MTTTDALVFLEEGRNSPPKPLIEACRTAELRVVVAPLPPTDAFGAQLPSGDRLLLLPLIREDNLTLHLAEVARAQGDSHEVLLFCDQLPGSAYLSRALQHGIRDVLAMNLGASALCGTLLRAHQDCERRRREEEQLVLCQVRCEDLHGQVASLRKLHGDQARRYDQLCGLTMGLATGQRVLERAQSVLYVLTASVEFREAVCSTAESLGLQAVRCADANDCLDRVEQRPPALVVCDQQIGPMSATEFSRHARMRQGTTPLTVIAWTNGYCIDREQMLGALGGVDDILSVPANCRNAIGVALLLGLDRFEKQLSGN